MKMAYKKLGDVCEILDSKRIPITASERKSGQYPYYGANGVQDYVSDFIFDDELVLLAEDGGNFGSKDRPIAYRVSGKCWVNNHAHVLKPLPDIDVDYLCYALMFYDTTGLINGATRQKLTQSAMRQMQIPIRSLDEQKAIVQKISTATGLITLRKTQLQKLDQLASSRFIEMFGDPIENPKGWKQSTIGAECYYIKDGPHKSPTYVEEGGIPFISTRNVVAGDGIDWQTAKYISEHDYQECIRKCHPVKGDILYSKGGTTGIARLVETDRKFANWVHVAVLKFGQQLNGKFFESMLNSRCCYLQSQRLTKGIANRDFVLSSIAQVIIIVPPLELQNEFAAFIEQLDKSKVTIRKSIEKLETTYRALLQEYFG